MTHNNEKGFSAVEGFLIVILVGLIGFVGWYVWKNQTDKSVKTDSSSSNIVNKKKVTTQKPVDPTADWITYSNKAGMYTLRYPKTWVKAAHPESCTDTLLLLGGNNAAVGKCASEAFGQMGIDSVAGNKIADHELKVSDYSDLVTEKVTINGVTGQKQTGTYSGVVSDIGFGPEKGDKQVKYLFYTNNRTYSATYNVDPAYPDVLSDFILLVTKTFQFKS